MPLYPLTVRARFAQAVVGHDVRGHVQRPLDGQLKSVFHETFLKQIALQGVGIRQSLEFGHAGFDKGELFRDQPGIGQGATESSRR